MKNVDGASQTEHMDHERAGTRTNQSQTTSWEEIKMDVAMQTTRELAKHQGNVFADDMLQYESKIMELSRLNQQLMGRLQQRK